ncbi:MAG: Ig-like domain-containing protein [Elusimicrobia bacterium]|nr:Ig-like domain-containing protein [Elusimicrobiota bacterium]
MKTKLFLFSAFYFLLFTCHLSALPDLTVSDISFSDDSPSKNQEITISATIINNGDNYSNQVVLTPETSSYQTWTSSGTTGISSAAWFANYFEVPSDVYLGRADIVIRNLEGITTNYITVEIRETVVDFGSIEPGAFSIHLLDSDTLSSPTTYHHWQEFTFDSAPKLSAGTTYWLCVGSTASVSVAYGLGINSGVGEDKIAGSIDSGTSWTGVTGVGGDHEINFKLYKCTDTIVKFFDGDPDNGGTIIYTEIIEQPIYSGTSVVVSTSWVTSEGSHSIYVVVDYPSSGIISESNENNNSLNKNLTVETAPIIVSVFPQDKAKGVDISTSIYVSFSEDMEEVSTEGAISVKAIRDNEGNSINSAVTGTAEYVSSDKKLIFTAGFKNNYTYEVIVSVAACDIYGNNLNSSKIWTFSTVLDKSIPNIVKDPDNPGLYQVTLAPGALSENVYIIGSTTTSKTSEVEQANTKLQSFADPFHFFVPETLREFTAYNSVGDLIVSNFSAAVTITIPYTETAGIVNNTSPPVSENTLSIYYLNEDNNLWVRLPGSTVNSADNTVTAVVPHFSVFAILGTSANDLSNAYAYPVPFRANIDTTITFTSLSSYAKIKIFTISGELVKEIEHMAGNPWESWNVRTDDGNKLSSGVYIYCIENDENKKFGKIVIIK